MHRNILVLFSFFLSVICLNAQTAPPNGMLYQAVARDAAGNLAAKRTIYVQTSILKGSATGTVMYSDEHKVSSNADAMFAVVVGQGKFLSGSYSKFSDIPWGNDKYFFNLKISVAPSLPGSAWKPSYVDVGTSQFWSVPYAEFARKSADSLTLFSNGTSRTIKLGSYRPISFSVADKDSLATNEIQTISCTGGRILLNLNGGMVFLPDSSSTNELQSISRNGGRINLSLGGGTITLPDSSATNELQTLSRNGGRISLSQGGGIISLPDSSASNELQTISKTGSTVTLNQGGGSFNDDDKQTLSINSSANSRTLSISGGNSVVFNTADADSSTSNELQNLAITGSGSSKRLSISNGNSVTLNISDADSSTSNELQVISRNGGRITLNQGGGTITLPDSSASNELQTITQSGNTITLSQGGGSVSITDNDKQQLSISSGKGSISLSNGGSVQLADSSASNELQNLSIIGASSSKRLSISNGNSITLNISDADSSTGNELQSLSQTGGRIILSQGGGTVFLRDSSSTNELQTISKSGSTVTLSQSGGSFADDDKQTLGVSGSGTSKTLSISGGNSVVINTADADSSATNELQNLSISGAGSSKRIAISNGNSITLNISDADSSTNNELQTISRSGGRISLNQGGGTITLPDSSASNEIQTLSQSGNTISLSNGGGSVTVTDNDKQTLSISGSGSSKTLSISGGNSVNINVSDADSSRTNEIQALSQTGGRISLSQGGGTVFLRDSSSTNELQTISKSGSTVSLSQGGGSFTDDDKQTLGVSGSGNSKTLSISGGNSIVFNTADADSSASNELQNLSITGTGSNRLLSISNGNSVTINVNDADSSVSNELQTLSLKNDTLSISNGNKVILPNVPFKGLGYKSSFLRNKTLSTYLDWSNGPGCNGSATFYISTSKSVFFASDTITAPKGQVLKIDNVYWSTSKWDCAFVSCVGGRWQGVGTARPVFYVKLNNNSWTQPTQFPVWLSDKDTLIFIADFKDALNFIGVENNSPQAYGNLSYFITGTYLENSNSSSSSSSSASSGTWSSKDFIQNSYSTSSKTGWYDVDTVYFQLSSSNSEIIHSVFKNVQGSTNDMWYHYKLSFIDSLNGNPYDGIVSAGANVTPMSKSSTVNHLWINYGKTYSSHDRLFFTSGKNMTLGVIISVYMSTSTNYYGWPKLFNATFETSFLRVK